MNSYISISNELYSKFEKVFKKEQECELIFLDQSENKMSTKSKILNLLNIHGSEYMKMANGLQIRLDRILTLNGEMTKPFNHY